MNDFKLGIDNNFEQAGLNSFAIGNQDLSKITDPNLWQAGMSNLDQTPQFLGQDAALFTTHTNPVSRGEYIYFFSNEAANSNVIKKVHADTLATTDVSFVTMGNNIHYCFHLTPDNKILVITNSRDLYLINEDDTYILYDNLVNLITATPRSIAYYDSNTLFVNATIIGNNNSNRIFKYSLASKSCQFVVAFSELNESICYQLIVANNKIFAFGNRRLVYSINLSNYSVTNLQAAETSGTGISINGVGAFVNGRVYTSTGRSGDITIIKTEDNSIENISPKANASSTTGNLYTGAFLLPNGNVAIFGRFTNYAASTPVTVELNPITNTIIYPTTIDLSFLAAPVRLSDFDCKGHIWIGSNRLRFDKSKTLNCLNEKIFNC